MPCPSRRWLQLHPPADGEAALERDQADVIAMARSWISNPDWVKLAYEGREDDIIPCLRCNKCHRTSEADPFLPGCSVNPPMALTRRTTGS